MNDKKYIQEEYVSYETAKLLKEKGFDGVCDFYYPKNGGNIKELNLYELNYQYNDFIKAPTQQMVMRWLRKVHYIHIMVNRVGKINYDPIIQCFNGKDFEVDGYEVGATRTINGKPVHVRRGFKTCEEAIEAAIKYCLKNLISIRVVSPDEAAIKYCLENILDKGKHHDNCQSEFHDGNNSALYALKRHINTLEVKEVDLEKEIDDYMAKEWEGIEKDKHFYDMIKNDLSDIAKHFFELGLNVSNSTKVTTNIDDVLKEKDAPADKIEPKFKVGDWVVRGNTKAQILDVQEQYYVGIDTNGKDFTSSRFLSDDKIHLWTIKDAKSGEVLVSPCCCLLWIYKTDKVCHVGYNLNYQQDNIVINNAICIPTNVMPATKEQRDLLFQKMKEAGYEWDIEKKELKKIKQKIVIPKFRVGDIVENIFTHDQKCITSIKDDSYITDNVGFIGFYDQDDWELVEHKTVKWSEEDENMLESIKEILTKQGFQTQINWLKSLRPRSNQEVDEQIETIATHLDNCGNTAMAKILRSCNLRPQKQWKPTNKQICYLQAVVNDANNARAESCQMVLKELLEQLKTL